MNTKKRWGVAIGRFQLHELHEGHIALLDHVSRQHQQMLVLIGETDIRFTPKDPYPFFIRKLVLQDRYPRAEIRCIKDSKIGPEHWSSTVDACIAEVSAKGKAVLYGSRDCFISKYSGMHQTKCIDEVPHVSATKIRGSLIDSLIETFAHTLAFRVGWLAAIMKQYKVTDPTVDVVIHTSDWSRILMGRRGAGSSLRFFGGFVDPADQSYEDAAKRERSEEALDVVVTEPAYIGSLRINDPRYMRSTYGIMTAFYGMEYKGGIASAGDDMGLVEWCDLEASLIERVSPTHHGLFKLLLAHKEKQLAGKQ